MSKTSVQLEATRTNRHLTTFTRLTPGLSITTVLRQRQVNQDVRATGHPLATPWEIKEMTNSLQQDLGIQLRIQPMQRGKFPTNGSRQHQQLLAKQQGTPPRSPRRLRRKAASLRSQQSRQMPTSWKAAKKKIWQSQQTLTRRRRPPRRKTGKVQRTSSGQVHGLGTSRKRRWSRRCREI